ncbi:MAG: 50S ribosomal protein L31e [Nanoarchaeota archaeon]
MAEKEAKTDKLEREYIINIRRKVGGVAIYKRAPKAIRTIKEFLVRHMKIRDRDLRKVKLDRYLNEYLWARGIRNPQTRLKIKAVKEGDIVRAELSELPNELKFKKQREEKREQKGTEAGKKKKAEKKTEETRPSEAELEKKDEEVKEEKEKKSAIVEAGKMMEKAAGKRAKHETKGKAMEPKHEHRMALQK